MEINTELMVNGSRHTLKVDSERTLLSVLREELDLTGTKYGCGEARCGACLVLLDGERVPSCTTPVREASGKGVTTIEGLEQGGKLHPLQEAFIEMGAFQCAYCTSGMIIAGVALLKEKPRPTEDDVKEALETNVCRCGTHPRIVSAVLRAAEKMNAAKGEAE